MMWKLSLGWPSTNKKQIIISQRLAEDPFSNTGFYVAMQGDNLIIGTGEHGSNEISVHNAAPAEVILELDLNCLTWSWGDDTNETIGLMFFTPHGDTLFIGEDPQMPAAKFAGSIEISTQDVRGKEGKKAI